MATRNLTQGERGFLTDVYGDAIELTDEALIRGRIITPSPILDASRTNIKFTTNVDVAKTEKSMRLTSTTRCQLCSGGTECVIY